MSPWFQLADEREALTRQANARDAVLERRGEEIDGAVAEVADNLSEYNIRAFIAELLRNRSAFGPGALAALETGLVLPEVPERTKKATKALRKAASILAGGGVTDKRHAASLQRWANTGLPPTTTSRKYARSSTSRTASRARNSARRTLPAANACRACWTRSANGSSGCANIARSRPPSTPPGRR